MQQYRSLKQVSLEKSWLTIGVFDGVHRGHQQIIKRLTAGAHEQGVPAVVLTFEPHPAKLFGRGEIKLLTLPDERADLLGSFGVDVVITHTFDQDVANTTALDFMRQMKSQLGVSHLVLGYTVEVVPALSDESGVISSTEIRKLIEVGNVTEAARLMGHPYSLHGPVVGGDQRGRTIDVPTANIA